MGGWAVGKLAVHALRAVLVAAGERVSAAGAVRVADQRSVER